jgi:hypothetical protein
VRSADAFSSGPMSDPAEKGFVRNAMQGKPAHLRNRHGLRKPRQAETASWCSRTAAAIAPYSAALPGRHDLSGLSADAAISPPVHVGEFHIDRWDNRTRKTIKNCLGGLSATKCGVQGPNSFSKGNEFRQGLDLHFLHHPLSVGLDGAFGTT